MKTPREVLEHVAQYTSCEWTRGFIEAKIEILFSDVITQIRDIIENNRRHKIRAIREIRALTRLSLKEAKDLVDNYWNNGTINYEA